MELFHKPMEENTPKSRKIFDFILNKVRNSAWIIVTTALMVVYPISISILDDRFIEDPHWEDTE